MNFLSKSLVTVLILASPVSQASGSLTDRCQGIVFFERGSLVTEGGRDNILDQALLRSSNDPESAYAAFVEKKPDYTVDPWTYFVGSKSENYRKLIYEMVIRGAYRHYISDEADPALLSTASDLYKAAEAALMHYKSMTERRQLVSSPITHFERDNQPVQKDVSTYHFAKLGAPFLCASYSMNPKTIYGCSKGLAAILRNFKRNSTIYGDLPNIEPLDVILNYPETHPAILELAIESLHFVRENREVTDFRSAIYQAFRRTVSAPDKADFFTANLVALIASRGENFDYANEKSNPYSPEKNFLAFAIQTIAASVGPINARTLKSQNRLYAMPASVQTTCDTGKPYHFWYSYYLTKWLMDRGVSPEGALLATYLADVGYQMFGRTSETNFKALSNLSSSYSTQKLILDLHYSIAGAAYAAGLSHGIDLDDKIRASLDKPNDFVPMDHAQVKNLRARIEKSEPLALFDFYKAWTKAVRPKMIWALYP